MAKLEKNSLIHRESNNHVTFPGINKSCDLGEYSMKMSFSLLFLLASFNSYALPISCYSVDKTNGIHNVKIKISDINRVTVIVDENTKRYPYIIGISYYDGSKEVVYGSGSISEKFITLSLIKDQTVLGYLNTTLDKKQKFFEGTARKNKGVKIKCADSSREEELKKSF